MSENETNEAVAVEEAARKPARAKKPKKPRPKKIEVAQGLPQPVYRMPQGGESVESVCKELQSLQRERTVAMKSRIMMVNRIQSVVAGTLGYSTGMEEKARKKVFADATEVMRQVCAGTLRHRLETVIVVTQECVTKYLQTEVFLEGQMKAFAAALPVADWACEPEQKGFGILSLGKLIGETGDLSNYANPAKVWRRMGLMPWTWNGRTQMALTWRVGGDENDNLKLPGEEWKSYGFSPRRRSISYQIGASLVKLNYLGRGAEALPAELSPAEVEAVAEAEAEGPPDPAGDDGEEKADDRIPGPYRRYFLEKKADYLARHPEYVKYGRKRADLHGNLMAVKTLYLRLWCVWHGRSWKERP